MTHQYQRLSIVLITVLAMGAVFSHVALAQTPNEEDEEWHLQKADGNNDGDLLDSEDQPGSTNMDDWWDTILSLGQGVTIGVIDDGLDTTHEDLVGATINYILLPSESSEHHDPHGQAVVGILMAQQNSKFIRGILPQSDLLFASNRAAPSFSNFKTELELSVLMDSTTGDTGSTRIAVHQNSWYPVGYPSGSGSIPLPKDNLSHARDASDIIDEIRDAYTNKRAGLGVAFTFAAGNESRPVGRGLSLFATLDEGIAVAALSDDGKRNSTSNFGYWIDVAAPGADIRSLGPDDSLQTSTGTSFASPMVAGVIGQMVGQHENIEVEQIRRILHHTARLDDFSGLPALGYSQYSSLTDFSDAHGHGHIDAFDAIFAAFSSKLIWGGFTYPAPATDLALEAVPLTQDDVKFSWTNPSSPETDPGTGTITRFNGEFAFAMVVRYDEGADLSWRPVDGVSVQEQITPRDIHILSHGAISEYTDINYDRAAPVHYGVFIGNQIDHYSKPRIVLWQSQNPVVLDLNDSNSWTFSGAWELGAPSLVVSPYPFNADYIPEATLTSGHSGPHTFGTNVSWDPTPGTSDDIGFQANIAHMMESDVIVLPDTTIGVRMRFHEILEVAGIIDDASLTQHRTSYGRITIVDEDTGATATPLDWHLSNTYAWRAQEIDLTDAVSESKRFRIQVELLATLPPPAFVLPTTAGSVPMAGWWVDTVDVHCITRSDFNRDGTVDGADTEALLAMWGPCATSPPPCPEDVNGDGQVSGLDLSFVLAKLDTTCSGCPEDINQDGVVDNTDKILVLSAYGACPGIQPCSADLNDDGTVDGQDLAIMLTETGDCVPVLE
ncbi:MAG: S8 family serine peptidase [Phycisphaerales bacterium JB043]